MLGHLHLTRPMWEQRRNDDGGIIGAWGIELGDEQSPWGPAGMFQQAHAEPDMRVVEYTANQSPGHQALVPFPGFDIDMNAYAEMASQAFGPADQVNSNTSQFPAIPPGSMEGTEKPRADCKPAGLFGSGSGQGHHNNVDAATVRCSSCIASQAAAAELRQGLSAPKAFEPGLVGWNGQPSDGCNPSGTSTETRPPPGQTR